MPKQARFNDILLQWTENISASDVQDPLGTSLRGSTRLAEQLLFCVTSITPRARYFSFLPWSVFDYQKRERGQAHASGLRQGIKFREHALVLGCVAHHDGKSCPGGALIGVENAIKWYATGGNDQIDFRKKSFVKNPALDAYYRSLVNLGVFVTEEDLPELGDDEEPPEITFEDLELSELGNELAAQYESLVAGLKGVEEVASWQRTCTVASLKAWGQRGGVCELASSSASECELLRDVFFCRRQLKGEAHLVRRRTLLLLLALCATLTDAGWAFDDRTFADSVYFGQVHDGGDVFDVRLPDELADICTRWRMFYFHYYMAVSLEGMLSWLVTRLHDSGLQGSSLSSLVESLKEQTIPRDIHELTDIAFAGSFMDLTPSQLFESLGLPGDSLSRTLSRGLDEAVRADSIVAESALERALRRRTYTYSSTGFAVPLVLLALTIARYRQWNETQFGHWFASVAVDPYVDLIPPVVLQGLERQFLDWWTTPFGQLGAFVLNRFVIQQHQSMSYVKSKTANRCLLQLDGSRLCATGVYDTIGIRNARFRSALQVLIDLGLLARDETSDVMITPDGRRFLHEELAREVGK